MSMRNLAISVSTLMLLGVQAYAGNNLIENGDFESGNTGFETDFRYSPGNLWPEAVYDIVSNPYSSHRGAMSFCDHTSGNGLMMAINGSNIQGDKVWTNTVLVKKNRYYWLGFWLSSWSSVQSPVIVLDVQINQNEFLNNVNVPAHGGQWEYWSGYWFSGDSENATITFINPASDALGFDFSLDDIKFYELDGSDIDRNCTIDIHDIELMSQQWLSAPDGQCSADINTDNFVDIQDFGLLAAQWLTMPDVCE